MISIFGLSAAASLAILIGGGVWLLTGLPFAVNGVLEKRRKYGLGVYTGGFFRRMGSYTFAMVLAIVFSPILFVFWLGKRAGRKQVSQSH
ncbi:hypothetical protein KKF05_04010 [Patescibacteria group bacterium]|nr:hypothetical protein [Patescibacteria group bacterium]MBU1028623.1 hypothetical protein [Patescibacteria group bacterium]